MLQSTRTAWGSAASARRARQNRSGKQQRDQDDELMEGWTVVFPSKPALSLPEAAVVPAVLLVCKR